jgi:septal ring factor EnvC (AmiA/AmiB activator)
MQAKFTVFFCLLMLFTAGGQADSRETKQKELKQLKNRIEKLRNTIEVKESSKSHYSAQLRKIEKQIGQISKGIRDTSDQLRAKEKSLDTLNREKTSLEKAIRGHNRELSRQLHAAYTLGRQEHMKLLFSQQSAANLQRNLTYYQYLNRSRLDLIERNRKDVESLNVNRRHIAEASKELSRLLSEQKQQKTSLTKDRKQRESIVANLEKQLKTQGQTLQQLEANARNLTRLIDSLSDILSDIPVPQTRSKKFAQLRGQLAWPVKGKVDKLFGRPKPPSNLRWQGVVIKAPAGNNVRAVSHGRVAFSDWLRGMGNLIIIDHGDGYLSLYGHNQSLFKTTGEWVEAGDIIASIGNSGGQKNPGLYFEIRKRGKPQNPSRWCKTENWFAT